MQLHNAYFIILANACPTSQYHNTFKFVSVEVLIRLIPKSANRAVRKLTVTISRLHDIV